MRRSIGRTVLQRGMAAAVALASLTAGGCGSDDPTLPSNPVLPTPVTTTETFSGELKVNGASTYAFLTAGAGTITVQLTTVDPAANQVFGLSLGTWNGTSCQVIIANDSAVLNSIVTGQATAAINLCARVYDAGRLADPLTYTITVVHP